MTTRTMLWMLCAVWSTTLKEGASCPRGAQTHLSSVRCLWLSQVPAAWPAAVESCGRQGGDVADVHDADLQMFISKSFPEEQSEWIWVKGTAGGVSPSWQDGGGPRGGACLQLTLGVLQETRTSACDGQHRFLCEKTIPDLLPSADSFLTGVVLMSAVYAQRPVQVLPRPPDVGQQLVEMQIFPGLWFSHAGSLSSVEMVVQPSAGLTQARVQILRPYCSPDQHLVPPGCVSLLNPFSACSPVPLCNTTVGCGLAQHWCPLLEACVHSTLPCGAYDPAAQARGFTVPPRHGAGTPFYHLAADLPLSISPSHEPTAFSLLLPPKPIAVYPDDIVAVQHTRVSGRFLHCRSPVSSVDSAWRQSYLSLSGPEWGGWRDGALTSPPHEAQWVDGVVCDFKITYVDSLRHATEFSDIIGYVETTPSDIAITPVPSPTPTSGLTLVHPAPDDNTVHVQINVPTQVVVKMKSGGNAKSLWSGPVLQSDGVFLPFCPREVSQTSAGCVEARDAWFSSATLLARSVGEQTLSVTAVHSRTWERLDLKVLVYEAVSGLSVEPRGCTRIIVDVPQTFVARVESGTSVRFSWVTDDQLSFTHQEPLYPVVLKEVGHHKVKVTASNPVSSQTTSLVLLADEGFPVSQPEFLFFSGVLAVGSTQLFSLRVKADVSLPVTFRWDLGGSKTHQHSAPCATVEGLTEGGVNHVYIQDSVNYTFSEPGDFTLTVQVFNQQSKLDVSKKIRVRQKLHRILLSSFPAVPLVNQTFLLEASTEPFSGHTLYTWDFGDSSSAVHDSKITHSFGSAAAYNITVSANNSISFVTSWILVEVMEKITGLAICHSGLAEMNTVMEFRATVATGSGLRWKYDFGDGTYQTNLTHGSTFHFYRSPGNYTVGVTVSNSVSEVFQTVLVEVYKLEISGILPTWCVPVGRNIHLTALLNGNMSTLTFHWLFGDGTPLRTVTGNSTTRHIFKTQGFYNLTLSVISSVTSLSYCARLCVEDVIANVAVKIKKNVVAVGEEVCFEALVQPNFPTGLFFKWTVSSVTTRTDSHEKCFIFSEEGIEEIEVLASNNVDNHTATAQITVQKPVGKLLVEHGGPNSTLIVLSKTHFWIVNCDGSNVTVQWNFGDSSPIETGKNVSHTFASTGQFIVTATASNLVSQSSVSIQVSVLPPGSALSIYTEHIYVATGEDTVFKAVSSSISSTNYYWTVVGGTSTIQGTYQFTFTFTNPGTYLVRVLAQNLVGTREAAIKIHVLERIEDLKIGCANLTHFRYIPVYEQVKFDAFAGKGSNISYHWIVIQSGNNVRTEAEGGIFHLMVEKTGEYSIKLTATNKLGEVTSSISVVAMERVKTGNMDEQKCILPLGTLANISLAVLAGSDLHFSWYVNSDSAPIQTNVPFLLHNCSKLGVVSILVVVQNVLSQSNVSKLLVVQEEIQNDGFTVEGKVAPFYIATNRSVTFQGFVKRGSDLHWLWTMHNNPKHVYATNETFTHTFHTEGTYSVALNVSNGLGWKLVANTVTVQDRIEGLVLNTSRAVLCRDEEVTFTPTVLQGTNVSFAVTFTSKGVIQTYDFTEAFTMSSLVIGKHLVTIKAWNLVSIAEVSTAVVVSEQIQGLQLVNCCSSTLAAFEELVFVANVESTHSINYTWIFQMEGYEQTRILGQKVFYNAPNTGILKVIVEASNGGCSVIITKDAYVELPVSRLELRCDLERAFLHYVTTFTAKANGSNLKYQWDFGDLTTPPLINEVNKVNHTYDKVGKYVVTVTAVNNVSKVSKQLIVEVGKIECSNPQVSIFPNKNIIFKSRPSYFEAIIHNNCSAYKTGYTWDIFACPNFSFLGRRVNFQTKPDTSSPFLHLPKNSLDVGQYCLVFTAFLKGTPAHVQQNASITVVHSTLVATIKGGSYRVWPSDRDLVMDGAESHDPDVEPGMENDLQYDWSIQNFTRSGLLEAFGRHTRTMTVPSSHLHPGTVYVFTLTIYKARRRSVSVNQTVLLSETAVPVTAECTSCLAQSSSHFSTTRRLTLSGQCEGCSDRAQYQWSVEDQSGRTLDFNETSHLSSPELVIHSGALDPSGTYVFSLRVYEPGRGQWGRSSLTLQPRGPPRGGLCVLSPDKHILALDTVLTCNCSEWQPSDDEGEASQLIYSFQVMSCQSESSCPVLTLYRGIRSVFGSTVPLGSQSQESGASFITIVVLIEDHLGSRITALERTVEVQNPTDDDGEWLRNKVQVELWPIVQQGNPQEIIPFSLVLLSHLNQVEPRDSKEEQERRELRQNVSQALASLSISSLDDAAQISSALMHSTAVPSELASAQCQESVLEAVGRMIHAMETPSEDLQGAIQTGRNILSVIGNTLAAVSKSQVNKSVSNQPAPLTAALSLSALHQTGALMRSLMRSHVQDVPLSITTPHIRTLAFHGHPSDFLCTGSPDQPSSPCHFEIPNSLQHHLQGPRSRLVQVILEIGDALEDNSLLTTADPSISTDVVAMEISSPGGQPLSVQGLEPENGIRVNLPWRNDVGQRDNQTCFVTALSDEERHRNFTVQHMEQLDPQAGLYVSFSLSLEEGASVQREGQLLIDVMSTSAEDHASLRPVVTEGPIVLTTPAPFTETTIFLSPLLNGSDSPLVVSLRAPVLRGGPVRVSVCVFSALCRFYDETRGTWSSEGLRPLEGTTLRQARCLSQHLTMFGASLFLHPGAVLLLPPSQGPVRTIVPGLVVAVLALLHLLLGLISHRLDHWDRLRLSQVPLCGRPGLYHYRVLIKTGRRPGAGTTAHVGISLYGVVHSGPRHLQREGAFQRGGLDHFHLETDQSLGEVWKIRLWHDNTGLDPSWFVQHVVVWDPQTENMFFFVVDDWLCVDSPRPGGLEREVLTSCPVELCEWRRVLSSQLLFGLVDRHLWVSVWERPAQSHFTRAQRVSCCALSLYLYLAVGALWYGAVGSLQHRGPLSAGVLLNVETAALGVTLALLVFPLQCLLCFVFGKAYSPATLDLSVPPSPVCHSVEMDVCLDQSRLSGPSFMSLKHSSAPIRDSPSSLLLDSSILDLWTCSGLMPQSHREGALWPSCDSLLSDPPAPPQEPPTLGHARRLQRKRVLSQRHTTTSTAAADERLTTSTAAVDERLTTSTAAADERLTTSTAAVYERLTTSTAAADEHLTTSTATVYERLTTSTAAADERLTTSTTTADDHLTATSNTANHCPPPARHLTTLLTRSDENLMMSIAAAEDAPPPQKNSPDSGRDSPLSGYRSTFGSSWLEEEPDCCHGALYRSVSEGSLDSMASTVLPSPSPASTRCSSTTRIGVARGAPGWLLPPWTLRVVYPLVAMLVCACMAVVGLYGTFFPRTVLFMWLLSALCAALTSALLLEPFKVRLLLEPFKVCIQAILYSALWRPVDPEVEDLLAHEASVVRPLTEHCAKIRPPCGYGLLQAKQEAHKVRALTSLMRHCVGQLLLLMLVLLVNYQTHVEQQNGRLLHSASKRHLHRAPMGVPNLTAVSSWTEAELWLRKVLVPHLHQRPPLLLVGLPWLQYTHGQGSEVGAVLGNSSETTLQLLTELSVERWSHRQSSSVSVQWTHYHPESGLWLCGHVQLCLTHIHKVSGLLSLRPLLLPPSAPDLQLALPVLLVLCGLLMLSAQLYSVWTERVQPGGHWSRCFHFLMASLSVATGVMQLHFLSVARHCLSQLQLQPERYSSFHRAALLSERSSECAAFLLTLLILRLLGTLRFVRRWVVMGRVLHRACRELWALALLLLLMLLLCAHLANAVFSHTVEGFLSVHQAFVSVLSTLRGHRAVHRLCRVHPYLGSLYSLLLLGGALWLLSRVCGAVLIRAYRLEKAQMLRPTLEPQDYEMVEFFIKRLKLWMGLTKAKEFRHRVKFEGMTVPPSRSSQTSRPSTVSSSLSSLHSPSPRARSSSSLSSLRLPSPRARSSSSLSSLRSPSPRACSSSSLSTRSEDSAWSEAKLDVPPPCLDRLLPSVAALLAHFDRVNQAAEDVYELELKLEATQLRRHATRMQQRLETLGQRQPKTSEPRHRRSGVLYPKASPPAPLSFDQRAIEATPRTRNSLSESESLSGKAHMRRNTFGAAKPASVSNSRSMSPASGSERPPLPWRRAWHSGSSHSADAAQRLLQNDALDSWGLGRPWSEEGPRRWALEGIPIKRTAWINEGLESEQE